MRDPELPSDGPVNETALLGVNYFLLPTVYKKTKPKKKKNTKIKETDVAVG